MRKNGRPQRSVRQLNMEIIFGQHVQAIPAHTRASFLAAFRRIWPGRRRVFWLMDPATGQWRRL